MTGILTIVLSLALLSATGAQGATWRESAEAAARALFERNLAAIESRDAAAYLACYQQTELLVRNGFGGIELGYAGLADGVGTGWPDHFEARDLRVFALTEDVVYGQYRFRVTYVEDEQEGISERVFLRRHEGWRIAVTTAFGAPPGALPPMEEDADAAKDGSRR